MPELTFVCPHCQQQIACDAAWAGQPVQCPLCQGTVTVPAAAPGPAPTTEPQPRLSIARPGQHGQTERAKPVYRQIDIVNQPKRNPWVPWLAGLAGVAILAGGGYFAYQQWFQPKESADAAPTPPPAQAASDTAQPPAEAAAANGDQQAPLTPPKWTLDLATATIPKGKVNGSVAGTNFVPETARLDFVGTAYLLTLSQGTPVSPDREVRVFLRPKAGQIVTNATWEVSKEMKGAGVPQVVKRWKANPRSAPQQKSFSTGYAMKLELRPASPETVSGRIFLALPDAEQSVVGGAFQAAFSPVMGAAAPAAAPTPAAPAQEMPLNPEYQKRYGIRR